MKTYRARSVPIVFVVDRNGTVPWRDKRRGVVVLSRIRTAHRKAAKEKMKPIVSREN